MSTVATASFYLEQVRSVTVLCFTVRSLTEKNLDAIAEELLQFLTQARSGHPIRLIMEFSSISEVDELAGAMLQAFHDGITESSGELVLCRVQTSVLAALRRSGLACRYARTRGEALWSF